MNDAAQILGIGSVLWDVIGRMPARRAAGAGVPGRTARVPGGVATNISVTLRRFGLGPRMLSANGRDVGGRECIAEAKRMGTDVCLVCRTDRLPADRNVAVKDAGGPAAANADARSYKAAGDRLLAPLSGGRLATDGSLLERLLMEIMRGPSLARGDLRVVPALPGKALQHLPLLDPGSKDSVS